jgi:hypothetical protein
MSAMPSCQLPATPTNGTESFHLSALSLELLRVKAIPATSFACR